MLAPPFVHGKMGPKRIAQVGNFKRTKFVPLQNEYTDEDLKETNEGGSVGESEENKVERHDMVRVRFRNIEPVSLLGLFFQQYFRVLDRCSSKYNI